MSWRQTGGEAVLGGGSECGSLQQRAKRPFQRAVSVFERLCAHQARKRVAVLSCSLVAADVSAQQQISRWVANYAVGPGGDRPAWT
jgi:hypothetical protein